MTRGTGAIKLNTTFLEGRLGLMNKRPGYQPTGPHHSPRSVLVWWFESRSSSSSSTSRPTLCTHWSLTGNTEPLHWAVTRGRRWLVHRPLCNTTVTRKGSMLWVILVLILKRELELLVTTKMTAIFVTPKSGLVQEAFLMSSTPVETWQCTFQIMETKISKLWVTSWCSDKENKNNCFKNFKPCRTKLLSINIVEGMEKWLKGFSSCYRECSRQITLRIADNFNSPT